MKNVIKSLFVAIVAMSVTFAYAQDGTKKAPAPKKPKMEKKDDGAAKDKPAAKKPAKKHKKKAAAKKDAPAPK